MYIYYESISDTSVTDKGVLSVEPECSHYFFAGHATGVLITECTFGKDTNMIPKWKTWMLEHLHKADFKIQTIHIIFVIIYLMATYFLPSEIHIGCMCAVTIKGCTYLGCTMVGGAIRMFLITEQSAMYRKRWRCGYIRKIVSRMII